MKKALLISCFYQWYRDRLEPIKRYLIGEGYQVKVLMSDFDHIKKIPVANREPECSYAHVPTYKYNISLPRIISHIRFGSAVESYIEKYCPDLIYILIPPNNSAKYCTKYKREHPETKLMLDIIDLWPESMPLDRVKNTPPMKVWKKWRSDCIEAADHIFTECRLYQKKLRLQKEKTSTLYHFKEQREEEAVLVKRIIEEKEYTPGKIKFAYLGSMNNIIDIEGICDVLRNCVEAGMDVELHAVGDGESRDRFKRAIEQVRCKAYFYGKIFDEKRKIELLASCDYAFNMMKGNISVGLTIKSIDYFSYGLPIINNIKGDTWKIVEKYGIGINVKDPVDINYTNFQTFINHNNVIIVYDKMFSKELFENILVRRFKQYV